MILLAEKLTSINPEILVWARKTSGVSLEDAEGKFGQEKLHTWENGTDYPTYSQLVSICEFYRKPIAICFFPEPPQMKNITTSFRTIPSSIMGSLLNRQLIKLLDEARAMQINLYELNDGINLHFQVFNQQILGNTIAQTADALRRIFEVNEIKPKTIKTSSEHFEYWRSKFADIGIYVFKSAFKEADTSGFCIYDEIFPVIYVNNSFSFTRQLFTLFHELYHLISKTSGIDAIDDKYYFSHIAATDLTIEKNCNAFAGSFLVPEADFSRFLHSRYTGEGEVEKLSRRYGVSREVILRKFLDAKLITQHDYEERSHGYTADYLRLKDNKDSDKSGGGDYYNTQGSYKGQKYIELVFEKYYTNAISLSQAASYMNMKIPSIRSFAEKKGWGTL